MNSDLRTGFPLIALGICVLLMPQTSSAEGTKRNPCGTKEKISGSVYELQSGNASLNGAKVTASGKVVGANGRNKGCTGGRGLTSAIGAGGCLEPLFSVAADLKQYRIGDIICSDDIAKKLANFALPLTSKRHPGCFVVQDTGGAFKGAGEGRFDFFTGTLAESKFNPFRKGGELGILRDKKMSCAKDEGSFHYKVIRFNSGDWAQKMKLIAEASGRNEGQFVKEISRIASNRTVN